MIIDGRAIAKQLRKRTAKKVAELTAKGIHPKLAVILVGDDKPSALYVKKKGQAAEKIGILFELHKYPSTISQAELEKEIQHIQTHNNVTGLIIQLPVPKNFYPSILEAIDPRYDVDCLTHTNLGKLVMKTCAILPPTPGAVKTIIKELSIDLQGKKVAVIGAGVLVGKPLSIILTNKGATVNICNEFTPDIKKYTLDADIIVSGVGKRHVITEDMVSPGTIVIDAGVNFENNQMFGDVDFEAVSKKASHITPTPGGIGPITVARLLHNTAICAELLHNNKNTA